MRIWVGVVDGWVRFGAVLGCLWFVVFCCVLLCFVVFVGGFVLFVLCG